MRIVAATQRNITKTTPSQCKTAGCDFKALDTHDFCAYHLRESMQMQASVEQTKRRHIMAKTTKKPTKGGKKGGGC